MIISEQLGMTRAEIVMTLLGKNIRQLLKSSNNGIFSKPTVYQIIIQLVSKIVCVTLIVLF